MQAAFGIAALWAVFAGTHIGLSSARVEPRLRQRIGALPFLGLYSAVALASFIPLVQLYIGNRHAGPWLWVVPVGPGLRVALYAAMTLALVVVSAGMLRPAPSSMGAGPGTAQGALRITRHPFVLGLAVLWLLHTIPNASAADLAFFGGFVLFSVAAAHHQDLRKCADAEIGEAYRAFRAQTPFLPFTAAGGLRGLRELPLAAWPLGVALALGIRWLHGSIWPY